MSFPQYRYYKVKSVTYETDTNWGAGTKTIKLVDAPSLDRRLVVVRLAVAFEDTGSYPQWNFELKWTDNGSVFYTLGLPISAGAFSIKFHDLDEIYWPLPAGRAIYGYWNQPSKLGLRSNVYLEYIIEENQTGTPASGGN